jgi:lipoate-protein ligase A
LITVDLTIETGRYAGVRLRGDFFVHPEPRTEEVIRSVEMGLTGLPADLGEAALAAHVAAAVPFGTELIGTTPGAIAVAVRRAVTGDADLGAAPDLARVGSLFPERLAAILAPWRTIPWRLLPEVSFSPALNVALDEVLTNRVASGQSPPTLRFWRWSAPAVIVGRCQSVANEVDCEAATALGVTVVRRMTGGGAMYLQPHGAITYSLYLPESAVAGLSIRESYEACESWVIDGLRSLGVDAHHVPINDIACSAGKIGGAAQARRAGVVLHHTTMAYDMDPGEMVKVLRVGREKLRDKAVTSAQKRVSPLVSQTGKSRQDIVSHLFDAFRSRFGGTVSTLFPDESDEAERLVVEKYASVVWTEAFD